MFVSPSALHIVHAILLVSSRHRGVDVGETSDSAPTSPVFALLVAAEMGKDPWE